MKLLTITASAALILVSGLSHAQLGAPAPLPQVPKVDGPTLEQTTAWISNKLATMPPFIWNIDRDGSPREPGEAYILRAFFNDCNATVAFGYFGKNFSSEKSTIYAWNAPLEELNADNFKLEPFGFQDRTTLVDLKIKTIGERQTLQSPAFAFYADLAAPGIATTIANEIKARPSTNSFFFLRMPDVETAQSVGNAFKHAAMLCRKKIAAQDAAKPARPKDLF